MRRLLCAIGIHKWTALNAVWPDGPSIRAHFACQCGASRTAKACIGHQAAPTTTLFSKPIATDRPR